jgi:hypothetical protein
MSKRKIHPSQHNRRQAKQAKFRESNSVPLSRLILEAAIGLFIGLVIFAVYFTSNLSGNQVDLSVLM